MTHPLDKFRFCPVCGSNQFHPKDQKSKKCDACGFQYYLNPSAANAAFILNPNNELLVATRLEDPGKGTFDLPGGFYDIGESAEEGVIREVKEETCLNVTRAKYLFSIPNIYVYSGFEVRTLDSFFLCEVEDYSLAKAQDDAVAIQWIPLNEIDLKAFGLDSIRKGVEKFLSLYK